MDFKELSVKCRTYRRFSQDPIDPAILDELMENVRIVSSAMNGQVLRYVVVKDPELVKALQPAIHWAAALPKELGTPKEGEQPVAFILVCKEAHATTPGPTSTRALRSGISPSTPAPTASAPPSWEL